MYFKITNAAENHNCFQYVDGLNILIDEFDDDPSHSCVAGGLYFSDAANIFKFLGYGIYLREVILPTDNPNFKMVKDPKGDKWRANMIILGKRYDLSMTDTFKYLVELGANIYAENNLALRLSAAQGDLEIVKYLVENGADIHANNDQALRWSANNGHLEIVKYLVECGANIHAYNDEALRCSVGKGHLEVYHYLKSKC